MTDSLRDRIAKGMFMHAKPHTRIELSMDQYEALADAVIVELGLKVEYGMGGQHDYSDKPEIHPVSKDELDYRTWYGEDFTFRYVTEWSANE